MCVCIIFSLNDIIYIYIYDFIYERNNNNCLILEYILFFFFWKENARIHSFICKYLISTYHCIGYELVVYNFSNIVVYTMTNLVNFSSYIEKEGLEFTGNLSMSCKIIRQNGLALIYHCILPNSAIL